MNLTMFSNIKFPWCWFSVSRYTSINTCKQPEFLMSRRGRSLTYTIKPIYWYKWIYLPRSRFTQLGCQVKCVDNLRGCRLTCQLSISSQISSHAWGGSSLWSITLHVMIYLGIYNCASSSYQAWQQQNKHPKALDPLICLKMLWSAAILIGSSHWLRRIHAFESLQACFTTCYILVKLALYSKDEYGTDNLLVTF